MHRKICQTVKKNSIFQLDILSVSQYMLGTTDGESMSGVHEQSCDSKGQTRRDEMAELTLEMFPSQRQASDKQPRLEIESDKQEKQFRVKGDTRYYGWFADSPSNRKAVLVFLREMYDRETGKWVFTEAELAQLVGSPNRQAVDGHMRGYRDAGGDILKFLQRQRKVDDAVVQLVWKVFCGDPYASLSSMAEQANASYGGEKPLSVSNVREALLEIPGYKVWREMLKGLEKGKAHYEEAYLLERLFSLLSEQSEAVEPESILAEGLDVSEMQGSAAIGEQLAARVALSASFREQVAPLFSRAGDGRSLQQQLMEVWEGPLGVVFLAFVLYSSGLRYATIGGWLGVDASTVCRWLIPVSSWGWMWLQQQRVTFSGQVAVDEKAIKIKGVTWYLFVAVDCVTRFPLHIDIYPSNNGKYCVLFLLAFKLKGYRPYVIVTDGWDAYIEAIKTVFPHAKHLLCRFHLIRSVFRRMRQIKFWDTAISKRLGKLFHSPDPRTVRRRVADLHARLSKCGKEWVLEGLLAKREQVMPAVGNPTRWPSTSNAAEWFFGAYDRFYRLKGPFQDETSARKLTGLFVLGYVFRMGLAGQACPLERAQTDVSMIPFYHLINRPKLSKLQELIAEQYHDGYSAAQENASA
jgi:transposase-like protein